MTSRSRAAISPCSCGSIPKLKLWANAARARKPSRKFAAGSPTWFFSMCRCRECDGFDVVEQLGKDLPAAVVFVTAYDQYALKAFEAGALDYLLKPFDNARFDRALLRAKERVALSRESPRRMDRLVIKGAGQVTFVRILGYRLDRGRRLLRLPARANEIAPLAPPHGRSRAGTRSGRILPHSPFQHREYQPDSGPRSE